MKTAVIKENIYNTLFELVCVDKKELLNERLFTGLFKEHWMNNIEISIVHFEVFNFKTIK